MSVFFATVKDTVLKIVIVVGMVCVSGCARYKAKSLGRCTRSSCLLETSIENQKKVFFDHHVFTRADCKQYLDRDVIAKGYQPINITITNNTEYALNFSTESFSFPCASVQEVAEKVYTNTTARAVGYGVVGLVIFPFLIPAIVDGIGSAKANDQLLADFYRKALSTQIIAPYSTISGLIFVPLQLFTPEFSFVVTDTAHKKRYDIRSSQSVITLE